MTSTKEEWRLAARRNREGQDDLLMYLLLGLIAALFTGEVIISDYWWLRDDSPIDSIELFMMNLFTATLVLAILGTASGRYRQVKRWFSVVERFAMGATSTSSRDLFDFADWLSSHWNGEFDSDKICGGVGYVFIANESPLRWAMSIAPRSLRDDSIERHLRVLVPNQPRASLTEWVERLKPLGFQCHVDEAGLIATLELAQLKRMVIKPERIKPLFVIVRDLEDKALKAGRA